MKPLPFSSKSAKIAILLGMSALGVPQAHSHEVDDLSARSAPLSDSTAALNRKVNLEIALAVTLSNQETESCDVGDLYKRIRERLAGAVVGKFEKWAESSPQVARVRTPLKESIYWEDSSTFWRLTRWRDRGVMNLFGPQATLRVGDTRFGTDKLGHFFSEGWSFFEIYNAAYLESGTVEPALREAFEWSIRTEETYFGRAMTGVKSYADMAANYDGFRFWSTLIRGRSPLVRCTNGRFEMAKRFKWQDYVGKSWDESVNCNSYRPSLANIVRKNLQSKGLSCPASPRDCQAISRRSHAAYLVHPSCSLDLPAGI